MHTSSFEKYLIASARLLALAALLVVFVIAASTLSGCSGAKASEGPKRLTKDEYKQAVKSQLDEFDAELGAYSKSVGTEFGSFGEDQAFTAGDIDKIAEMSSTFEKDASSTLKELAALKPPSDYEKEHQAIKAYSEFADKYLVPGLTKPMKDLSEGDTTSDFIANSSLTEQQNTLLTRLRAEFDKALETLGIDMGDKATL